MFLFIIGIVFHAKSLGRSPAWGIAGLLCWFSPIFLLFLKDKAAAYENVF